MKILVAVIAFNEEKNLPFVLEDLQTHNFGYDILLIDNGSIDNTRRVGEEYGVKTLTHCINSGGPAGTVRSYFLYAYKYGYDIVCQFDGDGQHIASELPNIVEPILKGEADYVIGSRFIKKEGFQSTPIRRVGIYLFNKIDSYILGIPITDITSGFRAYGRRVIRFFGHYYKHEIYSTSHLLLLSHFAGARIKEVPVRMRERMYGSSEFTPMRSASYMIKGFINVIGSLLQRQQVRRIVESYGA